MIIFTATSPIPRLDKIAKAAGLECELGQCLQQMPVIGKDG